MIAISKEKFPSMKVVRSTKWINHKKNDYFGPYTYGAFYLKNILSKSFKIRDCDRDMSKIYNRPCLRYYIKNCYGPCVYKDVDKEYNESVNTIKEVLRRNIKTLIADFQKKMLDCSDRMEFERAISLREQIKILKSIDKDQIIEYGKNLDEDIFVCKQTGNKIFIFVLNVREGKIVGKNNSIIDIEDKIFENVFENILLLYYTKFTLPNNIVLDADYEEVFKNSMLALEKISERKLNFHFPKIKSRRKELLDMAYSNLFKDEDAYFMRKNVIEEGIKEIYYTMNLKKFPIKIECFDISNIQGKDAVASMSVSLEGKPAKNLYRKFKIRCKDTPDDFSMMREVIYRRYSKLTKEEFPDVILIDGGLGQINAAGEILEDLGKIDYADLLSIAKREEEIYKYGENIPYRFSFDSEALKIFQRVRDEAHRFGITYHRTLRKKRIVSSELSDIEGVGEARRKKLLKAFGSVKKIKETSLEEIAKIVPYKVALAIKNKLKD